MSEGPFKADDFQWGTIPFSPGEISARANKILRERGIPYFGHITCNKEWIYYGQESFRTCGFEPTHKFIIIPDGPIARDTADSLLNEFVECLKNVEGNTRLRDLVDRARKVRGNNGM